MKKLIYLFIMVMLVGGCATTSSITPQLQLGMTKEEVLKKCGNPTQAGAIKDKEGRTLESFMYREESLFSPRPSTIITYVYFADGKVIYYGNPNPTPEPTQQTIVVGGRSSPTPAYQDDSGQRANQMMIQQQQQIQQQQMDYYKNLPKAPTQTNCLTHCDSFGNCNTNCQ